MFLDPRCFESSLIKYGLARFGRLFTQHHNFRSSPFLKSWTSLGFLSFTTWLPSKYFGRKRFQKDNVVLQTTLVVQITKAGLLPNFQFLADKETCECQSFAIREWSVPFEGILLATHIESCLFVYLQTSRCLWWCLQGLSWKSGCPFGLSMLMTKI